MKSKVLCAGLVGSLWPACVLVYALADAPGGTIDTALLQIAGGELDRELPILKAKASPAPYYLAYEITDDDSYSAAASFGALVSSQHNHTRGLDTTVRIGTPRFDNYHPLQGTRPRFSFLKPLSLDDHGNQIRRALWEETDRVYKAGSQRLLQLQTDEQLIAQEKQQDADFSIEPPQRFAGSPPIPAYDTDAWNEKLRSWSGAFRSHPLILASAVDLQIHHEVRTFVNTENSSVQQGSNLFRLTIQAQGLAADGMGVQTFASFEAADAAHLPSDKAFRERVDQVAAKVDALSAAPPAEPLVGPAILSGRASAVFFHEIFGHRIEGHRQKNIDEGQTFSKMLGKSVLPSFLSVQFDPTRRSYAGQDLIGAYDFDDEGVKARPVTVVDHGILKTFLLSRSPVGEFDHSNGHGRRQPGFEVESRQSNLIVESDHTVSDAELRSQLVAEIKRQNKPYGLYFEEVSSGYTTTGRRGLQAYTVVPLVVYRVFPGNRPDELIRGVDIVGTPLASFEKILATGNTAGVFNGYCGAESGSIPVSAVSPAILVSEIEIQKKANAQEKPPVLPRPEGT